MRRSQGNVHIRAHGFQDALNRLNRRLGGRIRRHLWPRLHAFRLFFNTVTVNTVAIVGRGRRFLPRSGRRLARDPDFGQFSADAQEPLAAPT